jgi:hypothetical protein
MPEQRLQRTREAYRESQLEAFLRRNDELAVRQGDVTALIVGLQALGYPTDQEHQPVQLGYGHGV